MGTLVSILFLLLPLFFAFMPADTFAQNSSPSNIFGGSEPRNTLGGSNSVPVTNPLKFDTVCGLIKGLLNAAIVIGIPIAVLFMVFAGLKFVLARGKPEDLTVARRNFLYTVVGIGIFLGSWVIIEVIVNTVKALGVPGVGACN